ncbi:PREDICTED: proton-coupled folate transporter-like [Nicrophorus vespilloides]|uniref:Proton-coupled folate transporter-like n=1 Tax=Nicrophorus vespilloides TaxID=110193 RepID=A0ABM1MP11_NICVS|nr:PREDICTED: proton-coupled folate transporter-like [Nicrophorus vespilloides]
MALTKSKSIEAELQTMALDAADSEDTVQLTFCQKAKLVFTNISVEPILVCYTLPSVMSSLAVQNLNLEKACRVDLALNGTVCDALADRNSSGYTEIEEIEVQKLVATAMAWKNVIQSMIPALLLMFLGSWSDRHNRRKPCILYPILGEIAAGFVLILCTYYFYELSIMYVVLAESIPVAITGGWFSMFMGVFSYISSVSSTETRTLRIGAVNLFSNVSLTIGIALSGILYKQIGFYGVFSLAVGMYTLGFLYGSFNVKECPDNPDQEQNEVVVNKGFFADFFDMKHVKDTLAVAFKQGARNRKKRICTIMILVMVIIGPMHGEMNVMYLFVRYKFQWSEIDYSIYSTFNFVAHMTGTLFSLGFFSKYLKLDDSILGMISNMSKILACLVFAFAGSSTVFYMGAIVEMFNGTSFIAMRSIISKLVPPDELGKIYSLFGVSEALMPLVYGPMYSIVYRNTINYLPGAFFLVGGFLTIPSVLIFFWLYTEHKKDQLEDELNKKHEMEPLNKNNGMIIEEIIINTSKHSINAETTETN